MKRIALGLASLTIGIAIYFLANDLRKPSIQLIGISSDSIVSLRDTLTINLKFGDRDGDIGDSTIGRSVAYVEDTAYKVIQEFPIITKSSTHVIGPVTGRLRVLVGLLPLLDTAMQRTTRLKVYITDRKGHKSNVVETPPIHLSRTEF